jgi:hypothetical protein
MLDNYTKAAKRATMVPYNPSRTAPRGAPRPVCAHRETRSGGTSPWLEHAHLSARAPYGRDASDARSYCDSEDAGFGDVNDPCQRWHGWHGEVRER